MLLAVSSLRLVASKELYRAYTAPGILVSFIYIRPLQVFVIGIREKIPYHLTFFSCLVLRLRVPRLRDFDHRALQGICASLPKARYAFVADFDTPLLHFLYLVLLGCKIWDSSLWCEISYFFSRLSWAIYLFRDPAFLWALAHLGRHLIGRQSLFCRYHFPLENQTLDSDGSIRLVLALESA